MCMRDMHEGRLDDSIKELEYETGKECRPRVRLLLKHQGKQRGAQRHTVVVTTAKGGYHKTVVVCDSTR